MIILFSENESYYREIGLKDLPRITYIFNGMKFYKKKLNFFYKFDLFVCAFYTMPHNIILSLKFNELKKNTILCSDGIFEFSNSLNNPMIKKYDLQLFHPIIQDYFICVGEKERKYFNHNVETLKFIPYRMLKEKNIIELPHSRKILITTANSAYFSNNEFDKLKHILLEITSNILKEKIDFSFRIFDKKILQFLSSSLDIEIENDISDNFENTLSRYSSIITTPSSISITSMYHQRSVAILIYRDVPTYPQSGWIIPSIDVFKDSLEEFINLDSNRIEMQNNILKGYLCDNGLTEHLEEISNHIKEKKQNDINNYINKNLYNMLNSSFNFNIEWFIRKSYFKIKNLSFIKKIRIHIK
ncbi:hypothetical protein [Photorhabdus stackebrandtii]|uniref:Uncharacterized protein n=1 Tax=Photorhabdus stackebrandtii TaxID=1123042 RepID=A0A7X5QL79_9GAMM|nr:hypothetical protein [Photorhabdus stackebrandtii]NHB96445.1 hypothetical protein [Photorhabdus stackebrandtii]